VRLAPAPVHVVADAPAALAAGLVVVALLRGGRHPRQAPALLAGAVALALEVLLAGGLLRLAVTDSFLALAAAAVIVLVRKVALTGVRRALRAQGGDGRG